MAAGEETVLSSLARGSWKCTLTSTLLNGASWGMMTKRGDFMFRIVCFPHALLLGFSLGSLMIHDEKWQVFWTWCAVSG